MQFSEEERKKLWQIRGQIYQWIEDNINLEDYLTIGFGGMEYHGRFNERYESAYRFKIYRNQAYIDIYDHLENGIRELDKQGIEGFRDNYCEKYLLLAQEWPSIKEQLLIAQQKQDEKYRAKEETLAHFSI